MLSQVQTRAAADLLFRHWQEGRQLTAMPQDLRPGTRAEGYAIQALLESRTAKPLFGWKIAATSREGQAHIRVDGPIAGRLLAERAHQSGAAVPLGANKMRVAEPEFAFRMAHTLLPRAASYETDEVLDAVDTLHPAIELPDSRFVDFAMVGAPLLIADNACAHEFVLGPAAPASWRSLDLARHPVSGAVAGKIEREGSGVAVLGDPRIALTWLVNELSGLGVRLEDGQVVTTGTSMLPLPINRGDQVSADFGALGIVALHLVG
jgi:2-keto-4-pentenoate hydratase